MNKLNSTEGSIMIGSLFLIALIIFLFIFAYETALLFMVKQKNDSLVRNISSSVILNIDTENMVKRGRMNIDESKAEMIAERILNSSYKEPNIFSKPSINIIYDNKSKNEIDVLVTTKTQLKKGFIFYKDVEIVSSSQYKAHTDTPLSMLKRFKNPFVDYTWEI